jgi:uncharacterized membrane protein
MNTQIESPRHSKIRSFLRIAGPILAVVGLIFLAIGMISFFAAFGSFQSPRLFWCCFVGMPILFVGLVMSKFGYFGSMVRYIAAESAPVAKDTFNYMAEGTKDGVRTVARSVAEGVQDAKEAKARPEPKD